MGEAKTDDTRVGKCWEVVKLGQYTGVHYTVYLYVSEIAQHSKQTGPSKIWPLTHILCFGYTQSFLVYPAYCLPLCQWAFILPAYTCHSWAG